MADGRTREAAARRGQNPTSCSAAVSATFPYPLPDEHGPAEPFIVAGLRCRHAANRQCDFLLPDRCKRESHAGAWADHCVSDSGGAQRPVDRQLNRPLFSCVVRRMWRREFLTIRGGHMVQFNATCAAVRWLAAATALGLMLPQAALAQGGSPQSAPARGGMLDCLPLGQPLPKIPEIATHKTSGVAGAANVLRGSILLANEKQRIVFRQPPGGTPGRPGLYYVCQQQTVRVFRGLNAQPPMPLVPQDRVGDPMPGPTLRARLGDIVQLTFVNNVNPGQYFGSFDEGEKKTGIGCDTSTAGYPANAKDTFPDCFHGSSTGNIHFHGTHTNPNSTGDNVFLEVRPSPIVNGKPTVTDKTFAK